MLLALTAVCAAGLQDPSPHAIRDAADAISTAYEDWAANFSHSRSDAQFAEWKTIYAAEKHGMIWILIPHPHGARYPGQGTHIRLDAKSGCMLSAISFD